MEYYYRRDKLRLEVLEARDEQMHFHQDIEILYVLSGQLELWIDGQPTIMSKEDVLIINTNKQHSLRSTGNVLFAKLTIMYELISDVLKNMATIFVCDSTKSKDTSYIQLVKLIQRLLRCYLNNKGDTADFAYISHCYQILDYICKNFLIRTAELWGSADSDKYKQRFQQIDYYIRANYQAPISINDLSQKLFLSTGYLSRLFKKSYGMSFSDYLSNMRLHHAVEQLLYTDAPITKIVYDNGFSSVAAFEKIFKKEYNTTPSAMRRQTAGCVTGEYPLLPKETKKRLEHALSQAPDMPKIPLSQLPVCLSVKNTEPLKRIWNKIINIGSAQDMLRSEVQEHILLLKASLDFTYARFWNPFSKEMFIDINAPGHQYNFSRLDAVFDFLQKINMLPFIELAVKPKVVNKSAKQSVIYELFDDIQSIGNWQALMEAFLHHIVARYGRRQVSQWRFELWFDAEKMTNDFQILAYSQRFKIAQEVIHKYSDALLGGCGMHCYAQWNEKKSENIRAFHKKMAKTGIQPDFITLYAYAYDTCVENGKIISFPSSDSHFMEHAVKYFYQDLAIIPGHIKVYFSEWNLTFSDRNRINDTCFKGAYIIKNIISLIGMVDAVAYFRGTDRTSEFLDTGDFLFGGTGLLTKESVQKPAAFAFQFLNRLYPKLVGKGDYYLVSTDLLDNYGIICHNCKKLSYNYYHTEENRLDPYCFSEYYEDLETLNIHLELQDVKNGVYKIKIYRVNEENGSIQQKWQETAFENDLSHDDIRYLQKSCEPRLSMQKLKAIDGKLSLSMTMAANEIAYISVNYSSP